MKAIIPALALALWATVSSGCRSHRHNHPDGGIVQQQLEQICREYAFPGMTVAWVADGALQGSAATGWSDTEAGRPMRPTTRMLAASIGKSFVGALCVVLHREGRLSLDAPVARWLADAPWFKRLPNHDAITLRHLLTHTAGLPDHVHTARFCRAFSAAWPGGRNQFTPEDLVTFILDEPPLFPVGQGWSYSDTGYILAGLAIEAATAKPLFEQISARFLLPLSLGDTAPANRRSVPRLAAGYPCPDNPFGFPKKTIDHTGRLSWHPGVEWAGGGLVSTSPDLATWGAALFTQGGVPGVAMEELLATVPMSPAEPGHRYGLGIGVVTGGRHGPVYGHAGWIPGYVSSLRHYPALGLTIALQINTDAGIVNSEKDVLGLIETRLLQAIRAADR